MTEYSPERPLTEDDPTSHEVDLCLCCSEYINRPHRVGCPLGTDDEVLLHTTMAYQVEHGVQILKWLEYVGFRSIDELTTIATQFDDYYQGSYPSVLDYAQEIAANLDEPPPIEQLVAEINQTMYIAENPNGGVYIFTR